MTSYYSGNMRPGANLSLPYQFRINRLIWLAIAVVALMDVLLVYLAGLRIVLHSERNFLLIMAACMILALISRYLKRDDMLFFFCSVVLQLVAVSYVVSFAEYYGATLKRPLMDAAFIRIEHGLGFDWLAYMRWLNTHTSMA